MNLVSTDRGVARLGSCAHVPSHSQNNKSKLRRRYLVRLVNLKRFILRADSEDSGIIFIFPENVFGRFSEASFIL